MKNIYNIINNNDNDMALSQIFSQINYSYIFFKNKSRVIIKYIVMEN